VSGFGTAEVRRALGVAESIGGPERPDPFPHETLEALAEIASADAVGYCESPRVAGFGGYELGTRRPPAWLPEALRSVARQDPTHPTFHGDATRTVAVSDLLAKREVERLDVHAAIWEPLRVKDSLRLYLGGSVETARFFFFDRSKRGFPETGRRLLELLRPTLLRAREAWQPPANGAPASLSPREAEILHWVAAGFTNDEIARRLWISPHTVRKHLENAYGKLGVRTRTRAAGLVRRI